MAQVVSFHREPETSAELYVMGRMAAHEAQAYEAHTSLCRSCRALLAQEQSFAVAMRAAAWELRMLERLPELSVSNQSVEP